MGRGHAVGGPPQSAGIAGSSAKLVPLGGTKRRGIRFGLMKGEIDISEDFDAPLPEDLQRAFEGEK
jgi:hypothetical protein